MSIENLKNFCLANGVSGDEGEVREIFKDLIKSEANEIDYDNIGSIIATKGEKGPKVAMVAHMDEVGFMVTKIDENGFIYFNTIGGWWSQVMLSQRVNIKTSKGTIVPGIIGSKPPHILSEEDRKQPAKIEDMFIDVGANNRDQVINAGIEEGAFITPHSDFIEGLNGEHLIAKAFDNRVACAIVSEVFNETTAKKNMPIAVGTVQEEVGLRGARTSAYKIKPHIAIVVDVTISGDTPGISEKKATSKMGDGPAISLMDGSAIAHPKLRNFIVEIAKKEKIDFQFDTLTGGGTDTGMYHLSHDGVPSICISIPSRYIHSNSSMISKKDYENTIKLIKAVLEKLDEKTYQELISY